MSNGNIVRQLPGVITGMRGVDVATVAAGLAPEHDLFREVDAPAAAAPLPEGAVVYQTGMGAGVLVALSRAFTKRDPDTGFQITEPSVQVQFSNFVAVVTSVDVQHRLEGCKGCELHPRGVPGHPGYGLGKMIWRQEEAFAVAKVKRDERDLELIKSNPNLVQRLLKGLQAAGVIDIPKRKAGEEKDKGLGAAVDQAVAQAGAVAPNPAA